MVKPRSGRLGAKISEADARLPSNPYKVKVLLDRLACEDLRP